MRMAEAPLSTEVISELDRLILQALQKDGRVTFTQIARQASVSTTTIRERYSRLVEARIVHTVGIVNAYVLGLQAPAILGISVDPSLVEQVAKAIADLPEVSYLVMTLGSFDLIVEVFCRDLSHLSQLITEQIYQIPGVRSTETLIIARSYKMMYRWSPAPEAGAG
jgi:Lrp/AsnC family transcriptional regulator, regulator for asnA, asnC and gidA